MAAAVVLVLTVLYINRPHADVTSSSSAHKAAIKMSAAPSNAALPSQPDSMVPAESAPALVQDGASSFAVVGGDQAAALATLPVAASTPAKFRPLESP